MTKAMKLKNPIEKMVPSNFLAIFCWVIDNLCQQETSHSTRGGLMHCRQWGYSSWFRDYGLIRKRGMLCFNQPGTVLGSYANPGSSRSTCKSNYSCKGLQLNNPVHFITKHIRDRDLHLEIPPARSFIDYSS